MHFRRARRQRIGYRTCVGCYSARISSELSRQQISGNHTYISKSQLRTNQSKTSPMAYWILVPEQSGKRSFCQAIRTGWTARLFSNLHSIRGRTFLFGGGLTETRVLDAFFESQEDPYMREKIVAHCAVRSWLQHITADYLDRIAKLKLFL
jgi:hypothetical protein